MSTIIRRIEIEVFCEKCQGYSYDNYDPNWFSWKLKCRRCGEHLADILTLRPNNTLDAIETGLKMMYGENKFE